MIAAHYKIGRCANGAERDGGHIRHAIDNGAWTAVCGAKPGRASAGWSHEAEPADKVNCPRCLKKLDEGKCCGLSHMAGHGECGNCPAAKETTA